MDREPVGRPIYDLMGDHRTFMAAWCDVGAEKMAAMMEDEIRTAMEEDGVRVALFYAERMQDLSAVLGEFTVVTAETPET